MHTLRPAPAALLSSIHPESSGLRPPTPWIKHRHWRVVGEQMIRGEHVLAQAFLQRLEPPAGAADLSGERGPREINAMAREDLRLPIERRVVAIFADQHLGKQRRRRQTAGDHPLRSRRLHHRLTGPTGIFGPSGPGSRAAALVSNPASRSRSLRSHAVRHHNTRRSCR